MTIEELKAKHAKFQYLKDEKSQLAAVQRNGYALKYCANASEAVQLSAVQQDGYALRFCANQSEAVQLAAVQQNCDALQFCKF
jgi:hypothetical protein